VKSFGSGTEINNHHIRNGLWLMVCTLQYSSISTACRDVTSLCLFLLETREDKIDPGTQKQLKGVWTEADSWNLSRTKGPCRLKKTSASNFPSHPAPGKNHTLSLSWEFTPLINYSHRILHIPRSRAPCWLSDVISGAKCGSRLISSGRRVLQSEMSRWNYEETSLSSRDGDGDRRQMVGGGFALTDLH